MRVVIADDSLLLREGLARLLADSGVEVVGSAENAAVLHQRVRGTHPDVAIVDIRMPPTHTDEGLVAARDLRTEFPRLGILVLSQYLESHYATALLGEVPEGMGYLLKDRITHVGVLVDALHRIVAGECVIDPAIVTQLMRAPRAVDPFARLSDREREVLAVMAEGRSNAGIAERLFMSEKTVESHVRLILQKLGIQESPEDNRRVLAVLRYLQPALGRPGPSQ